MIAQAIGGAPPGWWRPLIVILSGYGVVSSIAFLYGFLRRRGRVPRTSIVMVDQYLLQLAGAIACVLYCARWVLSPPPTWSGPWLSPLTLMILGLVDAAFTVRLVLWNRARREWRASLDDHDRPTARRSGSTRG